MLVECRTKRLRVNVLIVEANGNGIVEAVQGIVGVTSDVVERNVGQFKLVVDDLPQAVGANRLPQGPKLQGIVSSATLERRFAQVEIVTVGLVQVGGVIAERIIQPLLILPLSLLQCARQMFLRCFWARPQVQWEVWGQGFALLYVSLPQTPGTNPNPKTGYTADHL